MAELEEDRDPLEVLAAEFMERQRAGQSPSIAEYVAKYPELAVDIEELFPTISSIERLKVQKTQESGQRVSLGGVRLERLGDFLIIGEIGRGGMGIVYEAFQESLGRHVAVKVLPRQSLLDSTQLQRFQREAQTAARLHHTNIVPIFGVGEHEGYHYIVMQLIRGVGLDALIAHLRQKDISTTEAHADSKVEASSAQTPRGNEITRLAEALLAGRIGQMQELSPSSAERSFAGKPSLKNRTSGSIRPLPSSNAATEEFRSCHDTNVDGSHLPASNTPETAIRRDLGSSYWRSVAAIGLQVADALHYAHGHHTLHRDIKPANLLLDSQGIVWITDFGLAKAMEQDNVTQAGGMVGTLRYMAPEQFSGQMDARGDIYNLGLTLYELLALRPAFDDPNRNRLIRQITHDQPPALRKLNPAIPRDLETIVLKAIGREPRDRYQTAGDMARDLQNYLEDRPIQARRSSPLERLWRWSRRNRAVAGLAASTLLMLVVVAVVASVGYIRTTQANIEEKKQRGKAEETTALAIEALDNIFQQFAPDHAAPASSWSVVSDTGENISVPVQPVLSKEAAALLEHMLAFYDRLADQGASDARLQRKVAEANRRVGDIRQRLGHYQESKTAYLRAIAIYAKLSDNSTAETLRTEIARIHNELGSVSFALNDPKAGHAAYVDALKMLEDFAENPSASPQSLYELARTYYFLGRNAAGQPGPPPLAQGGPPGPPPGPQAFDAGRHSPPPMPPRPHGEKGPPHRPPSEMPPGPPFGPPRTGADSPNPPPGFPPPFSDQHLKERNENLQKGVKLLERLISAHPEVPDYQHLLARCYREISQQWFIHGPISTEEAANKATEILQKLVKKYPDVPDYRYDLSETYLSLANRLPFGNLMDKSVEQQSRAMVEKAMGISEELVAEHPNIPDYAVSLVHIRLRLAYLCWANDPTLAESHFRKALELQTLLARRFPQNTFYKFGTAFILDSLSGFFQKRDRLPEAQSLLQASIGLLKEALENDPKNRPIRDVLARNYMILADLLQRMGDEAAAAEATRQAKSLH